MASKLVLVCFLLSTSVLLYSYVYFLLTNTTEVALEETWWGEREGKRDDTAIHPFSIRVSQQELKDLELRLNITRPAKPPLENTQHQYGLNPKTLQDFLHVIKTQYNFTERQNFLNQYPQFITEIQGIKIHFLHVKPRNPDGRIVLPLLLLHGWPSSVREFYEMVPILTERTNRSFVFELVIPSLPGFGYSSSARKPDCQAHQVALMFHSLMKRLDHDRFYVHGSDWGAVVVAHMATLFPDSVLGLHSNFCVSLRYISLAKLLLGSLYPSWLVEEEFQSKLYPLAGFFRWVLAESAYLHLQGTKPDTIGATMLNSPESLFTFTLEKLSIGANKDNIHLDDAGLDKFDQTTLLDIILFYYWFPGTATTAARFYAENLKVEALRKGINNMPIDNKVPCGCAFFQHDFIYQPESVLRDKFTNLVHYTKYKSGGHFAALEETELLVKDIIMFVSKTLK